MIFDNDNVDWEITLQCALCGATMKGLLSKDVSTFKPKLHITVMPCRKCDKGEVDLDSLEYNDWVKEMGKRLKNTLSEVEGI